MSKPAHKIRIGVLQVTIWRNHGEKGHLVQRHPHPQLQAGRRDLEGNRQPGLRRFADDGQAVRPGPHLDHAPAAGRPEGPQGIRAGSRLIGDAGEAALPPAGFFLNRSTLRSLYYEYYRQYHRPQPRLIAVEPAGEIPAQCPPHRCQSRDGRAEGVHPGPRPDAEPRRHRRAATARFASSPGAGAWRRSVRFRPRASCPRISRCRARSSPRTMPWK